MTDRLELAVGVGLNPLYYLHLERMSRQRTARRAGPPAFSSRWSRRPPSASYAVVARSSQVGKHRWSSWRWPEELRRHRAEGRGAARADCCAPGAKVCHLGAACAPWCWSHRRGWWTSCIRRRGASTPSSSTATASGPPAPRAAPARTAHSGRRVVQARRNAADEKIGLIKNGYGFRFWSDAEDSTVCGNTNKSTLDEQNCVLLFQAMATTKHLKTNINSGTLCRPSCFLCQSLHRI